MEKLTFKYADYSICRLRICCLNCGKELNLAIKNTYKLTRDIFCFSDVDDTTLQYFKEEYKKRPLHCINCRCTFEIE